MMKAQIAQSVEQGIENPRVGGSIPPLGTTSYLISSKAIKQLYPIPQHILQVPDNFGIVTT